MGQNDFGEERTRELEVASWSAPYIEGAAGTGEDPSIVELVANESFLVAEPLPIRANPVSAYLAGLAESLRRPMRANLETVARLRRPRVRHGARLMELALRAHLPDPLHARRILRFGDR